MTFNQEKFMEFVEEPRISMFRPIKLEYSRGCMANSLSLNGIEEIDLTDDERKQVIHKIFAWYRKHPKELNNLLQYFIESNYNDYQCSEKPCECCGDIIETYKMVL